MFVNLLVDNAQLCEVYPYRQEGNDCNEMNARAAARRAGLRELENYIDAQYGGPGKGWFRIVKNPFEARKVINEGKLAVVMGIEISKLFDCGVYNDAPDPGCDTAQIDRQLDEVYRLGVRDMELVNKFDNALSGVAGDGGSDRCRREQREQARDEQVLGDADLRDRQRPGGARPRAVDRRPGDEPGPDLRRDLPAERADRDRADLSRPAALQPAGPDRRSACTWSTG